MQLHQHWARSQQYPLQPATIENKQSLKLLDFKLKYYNFLFSQFSQFSQFGQFGQFGQFYALNFFLMLLIWIIL